MIGILKRVLISDKTFTTIKDNQNRSHITCFDCNKKGYYINTCTKSRKILLY